MSRGQVQEVIFFVDNQRGVRPQFSTYVYIYIYVYLFLSIFMSKVEEAGLA